MPTRRMFDAIAREYQKGRLLLIGTGGEACAPASEASFRFGLGERAFPFGAPRMCRPS